MLRSTLSIANSMVPSQQATRQSFPAPKEFGANDWKFDINRAQQLNWLGDNYDWSSDNYFANNEPFQGVQQFGQLTGQEPIYGQQKYFLNPLAQEQTNSHQAGYRNQLTTRIADNMSAEGVMRFPSFQYPAPKWQRSFIESSIL